ncbi:hypothetical protein M422DRAFT_35470 [Sphaerobolus stellatus SS14]|uniref:Uncharacterized protein n=1 Tax=Sphaerobolus stellatus (strain SS14) TaxID=990650 RepID=A0A0C9TTE1_SPHS4|nr:hypothetical protein M422DRAFT_35470 [Sphaerobolus stellatus SS14]
MPKQTLLTLIPDVLDEIAFTIACEPCLPSLNTQTFPELLGPPAHLPALLQTCKYLNNALSMRTNPVLYARIFKHKFDFAAIARRRPRIVKALEAVRVRVEREGGGRVEDIDVALEEWRAVIPARALSLELKRRFEGLKRLYNGIGTRKGDGKHRVNDLWMVCVMLLENEGKNALQVKHFGCFEQWLVDYFLDFSSIAYDASEMMEGVTDQHGDKWPAESLSRRLATWSLWLTDTMNPTPRYSDDLQSSFCHSLQLYFLASHKYPIGPEPSSFSPPPTSLPSEYAPYGLPISTYATPPPLSGAAIPAFLTRNWLSLHRPPDYVEQGDLYPDEPINWGVGLGAFRIQATTGSERWDVDWERAVFPGVIATDEEVNMTGILGYEGGSLDGKWEGVFTDIGAEVYTNLVNGVTTRRDAQGIQSHPYKQAWSLHEYVLPENSIQNDFVPLPVGSADDAFIPASAKLVEAVNKSHLLVQYGNRQIKYVRWTPEVGKRIRDAIIIGQASSSALGTTSLHGRIRPYDGLISLCEDIPSGSEYVKYISAGYVTGGQVVGRWRACAWLLESTFFMGNHVASG